MNERKNLLRVVRADYTKASDELETLRAEVIKTLRGESTFSKELLSSLITETEAKCTQLLEQLNAAQAAYDEGKDVLESLHSQYAKVITWAEMYDYASTEAKKMIINCLINRIEVYQDYKLHIDFNIDFSQFNSAINRIREPA